MASSSTPVQESDISVYVTDDTNPKENYAARPYYKVATQTTFKVPKLRFEWERQRPVRWRRGSSWSTLKIEKKKDYFHIQGNRLTCPSLEFSKNACKSCNTPVTPPPSPPQSPVNHE